MCRSRSQRRQSRGVDVLNHVLSENTGSLHCVVRKHGQSSLYCQKTHGQSSLYYQKTQQSSLYCQKTQAVFTILSQNTGSLHCIVRKHGQSLLYCQKTTGSLLSENTGSLHCNIRGKKGQSSLYFQKTRAVPRICAEKGVICRSRGVSLAVCWTIRVPDGRRSEDDVPGERQPQKKPSDGEDATRAAAGTSLH